MNESRCIVIGAGPHGLSAAVHLRRAGVETRVFGSPMSFWETMPTGMLLRSNWTATSIAEYDGPLSLDAYAKATDPSLRLPLPLQAFHDYGMWLQRRSVPDVDTQRVRRVSREASTLRVTLEDGDELTARHVVVATGIADFVFRPPVSARLPAPLSSHTSEHRSFEGFRGKTLLVVGGGQSALESAALAHEAGADVTVVARKRHINWLHGGKYHRLLGRHAHLVYAPTDVGPMGVSRVVAVPDVFRRLPRAVQDPMARRSIRPAGAAWLHERLVDVPVLTGRTVMEATPSGRGVAVVLDGNDRRSYDHVMFGTGYRVDVSKYPFLDERLIADIAQHNGYPVLRRGMAASVPGLHFLGAPAAHSFGPIMRFVSGSWYSGTAVAQSVTGRITETRSNPVLGRLRSST